MLILASKSPQRQQILKKWGISFKAVPGHIDEHHNSYHQPHAIVQDIALRKAVNVGQKYPQHFILGVDTLVVSADGKIMGKPRDQKEAFSMIRNYSGRTCDIYSGVALISIHKNYRWQTYEKTRLYFRKLKKEDLKTYLKTKEWQERSGAMTLEGRGGEWVTKIVGDYWNVIGLPLVVLFRLKMGTSLRK